MFESVDDCISELYCWSQSFFITLETGTYGMETTFYLDFTIPVVLDVTNITDVLHFNMQGKLWVTDRYLMA